MTHFKHFLALILIFASALGLCAQDVPQAINFQAIARDANSEVMANTPIMIQLTILSGSPEGELVYSEIRSLTTNAYGSFSFQIGRDPYMHVHEFADIDWAGDRKFLKIDYDPTATLSFNLSLGTVEFVSVPYAFAAGSVSYIDASNANDGDVLAYNAATGRFEPRAISGTGSSYSTPTLAAVLAEGNAANSQIKNVSDPTDAQDAVTKAYLDAIVAELREAIANGDGGNGTLNGHDYVDLGLSVKWATCNVGSTTPEGYGDYYAWGETAPKTEYSSSTYSDNPTTLPASADAATVNMGSGWRMPTETEMRELIDNCTWQWTTLNGVNGYRVAGTNGNSIFLPAAGYRGGTETISVGSGGNYWSSSVNHSCYAWSLLFISCGRNVDCGYRIYGLSVRAVRP